MGQADGVTKSRERVKDCSLMPKIVVVLFESRGITYELIHHLLLPAKE